MLTQYRGQILLLALSLGAVPFVPANEPAISAAQQLFLKGRYAEALAAAELLQEQQPLESQLLQHALFLATGKREAAWKALTAATQSQPEDIRVLRSTAEWWFELRDAKQTESALAALLLKHPDDAVGRWLQAEHWQQSGRFAEAREAWKWFAATSHQKRSDDVAGALAAARGLTAHARWSRESKWFDVAVNELLGEAAKKHPADWRIPALRARLFEEKENAPAAVDALNIALAANASAAELHRMRAELALTTFDVTTAQRALEQARRVNPHPVELALLEAAICFAELRAEDAVAVLSAARTTWGDRPELLGNLAAGLRASAGAAHSNKPDLLADLRKQIHALGTAAAWAYLAEGQACEYMRHIEQARVAYEQAYQLAPDLPGVKFHLASQRLRLNENQDVNELLAAAFAEDPFNVRLKNTQAVLEVLQNYAILETDHFIIRFDRGRDTLLAKYVADYLEQEVYPELTQRFAFHPQDKSVIEIYNRARNTSGHGWFSARMVGLPSIHTIGACSGRIVALASPTDLPRPYNWARVLRHEFVHRLNLEQTRFQVPHWLTEGLAVEAEERPRPSDWTRLIAQRHREGKLFTLADINFGFIRPASSREWTLAYAQAELYIEFMRKQYGGDSVAKLLQAIAENYTTAEAIAQATKVPLAEFEAGYQAYVSAQVAQWNLSQAVVVDDPAPLQAALAKSPDDVALRANLAAAYLGKGELVLARRYATEALESKSPQQTAAFVLASLAAQSGNMAEAERIAQSHVNIAQPHPDLLLLLATSKLAGKQYPLAEKLLLLGRKHFPSLDAWEENLAKLYAIQKDHAKLQPILESLTWRKEDDASLPAKLMELAWEANDAAATERWAMATLRVNVNHDAAHAYRGMALADMKRPGESLAEFAAISKDAKMHPAWKLAFARVLLATGNRERAKELVEGLIVSAPDLPGLLELARELEK